LPEAPSVGILASLILFCNYM